jgi:hypothetical protein
MCYIWRLFIVDKAHAQGHPTITLAISGANECIYLLCLDIDTFRLPCTNALPERCKIFQASWQMLI